MAPKIPKNDKNVLKTAYNPNESVVSAPAIFLPPTEIKINPNNWMAKLNGTHVPTSIIGRLQAFFLACPLYGALTLNPHKMYHQYLCEFWYTAYLDATGETIHFTLKSGTKRCSLDVETITRALHLNYFSENELPVDLPESSINLREVLLYMGHSDIVDGDNNLKTKGTIFMKHLTDSWRYFFTHIVECLGGGSGGLDQINHSSLMIAYCLWYGRRVNFAEIIFNDLRDKLKGRRKPFVPFIRFLSLCFMYILGDSYNYNTIHYSTPEYMRDLNHFTSKNDEVEIPQIMLHAFRPETDETLPVQSEETLGGPQNNEGPTGELAGDQSGEPDQIDHPVQHPETHAPATETTTDDLQTGHSVIQRPRTSRRHLRNLSAMATDSREPALNRPESSQQETGQGQRETLQATTSTILVRGSGEETMESSQLQLESVSAQAHTSHISDTTLALTSEVPSVSPLVIEVTHSSPRDVMTADGTVITDGPQVTAIEGNEAEAEPSTGLDLNQDISDQRTDFSGLWDEDESTLDLDSNPQIEFEFSDEEDTMDVDHPLGPSPTSSPLLTDTIPVSSTPTTTITDTIPDPPTFPPPTFTYTGFSLSARPPISLPGDAPITMATRTTSSPLPPNTLDISSTTEVQNLLAKVEDLGKSILSSSQILSDFKSTLNNSLRSEISTFAGNEEKVFAKLNDLVVATNAYKQSLQEALQVNQSGILNSVQSSMTTTVEGLKTSFEQVQRELQQLVLRPTLDQNQVVSAISDATTLKLKNVVIKELAEQLPSHILVQLADELVPKVVDKIVAVLPEQLTNEVQNLKSEVSSLTKAVSQLKESSFQSSDRTLLENIWNHLRSGEGISKGDKTPGAASEAEQTQAAGTDASEPEPVFEDFPDIVSPEKSSKSKTVSGEGDSVSPTRTSVDDQTSRILEQKNILVDIYKKELRADLITHKQQMSVMGTLDTYNAGALGLKLDMYLRMKQDPRITKCLEALDDIWLRARYSTQEQEVDSITYGVPIPELVAKRKEALLSLQKKVVNNAAALEREYKKKKQPTSTSRLTRDHNLDTFVPMVTNQSIHTKPQSSSAKEQPEQVQKTVSAGKKKEIEIPNPTEVEGILSREKLVKRLYEMNTRADSRKILDVQIELAPDDRFKSRFKVKLTREQNFVDERPDCSVQAFGISELKEICGILKGKDLTEAEQAFIKKFQTRLEQKYKIEVALGKKESNPFDAYKRKAQEEAAGHISKK